MQFLGEHLALCMTSMLTFLLKKMFGGRRKKLLEYYRCSEYEQ